MVSKKTFIDEIIKREEKIEVDKVSDILEIEGFSFEDLQEMYRRIFDLNVDSVTNKSEAHEGAIGRFNLRSRKKREKVFWKRIRKCDYTKRILAEGDSWFEYPLLIRDLIDHLNASKERGKHKYAIYCMAAGGDWIANMMEEKEYVEMLSLIKPDVFLVSGGGNDIVGGHRLAQLVHKRTEVSSVDTFDLHTFFGKMAFANRCLNEEFLALIDVMELQYRKLFDSIAKEEGAEKFGNLKIITQGYDHAIPSYKRGCGIIRYFMNRKNNGQWLKDPLVLNGYNEEEQIAIVAGMIDHFNEMLIRVGKDYGNVYHIDSRGFVAPKEWYDELHPKSGIFKKIARVFELCIDKSKEFPNRKVYKVRKLIGKTGKVKG